MRRHLSIRWLICLASLGVFNLLHAAQAATAIGKPAPNFVLKTVDGHRVSLSQFKGKVVFVDFWMPNCPPCVVEAPHLQQLHKKYYARGLRLIGATQSDPQPATVRAFIRQQGLTYPLVMDKGMKVAGQYQAETHPYGVLIDRAGIVRYIHEGFLQGEEKQLEAAIQAVLAGRAVVKAKE
ncbi:MAG: TlpA family protein disulfide reductase [Abitibacteriaceae bacterium]|nr:TlpA family protein disulfide reductase [Abditibacteriaceae bacterium]MBV9868690.1 TlpA family protein disulfide reductase [Abditibacteriaceae bacterium]